MGSSSFSSVFDEMFDVVVVGSGYVGFAAALTLDRAGRRVLLIGPRGDLVWESGRGLGSVVGEFDGPEWVDLVRGVDKRGGFAPDWLDGAIAEVVATDRVLASGVRVLYYARPVGVEVTDGLMTGLVVATRSGVRRVRAGQWMDATETGELVRLVDPGVAGRVPVVCRASLVVQHAGWGSVPGAEGLRHTAWATERLVSVEVGCGDPGWRERVLVELGRLADRLGDAIGEVSLSHVSIEPVPEYGPGEGVVVSAGNVFCTAPALVSRPIASLADRFRLGVDVAADVLAPHSPAADPSLGAAAALSPVAASATVSADVCVVGTGTGGALAALAAARAGARVVAVDPLPFAGGIGAGGGIHGYYFGAVGGLQEEVDARTRELMKRFGGGPLGDGPFNPWAKMIALEQLLREAGVDLRFDALVFDVEKDGARVTAVRAATPHGVLRIAASGFVDGTGDGDLCALAGAPFTLGREHDGLLHAYSQSSGRLRTVRGRPRMSVVNFDAGFCDPTDVEDLTRARLAGVRQYLLNAYEDLTRPTYIAPTLGLRQGRQVLTDYVLTFDDQIRRRRFEDVIGFTGAHFDNHATDLEFESDEAVFWVWANHQFSTPVACELSYRMLLPRGLDNVWIGSRCLGVTRDAHNVTRMERDMQRVGEAAGFAAAEAARTGTTSRTLPYDVLRERLEATGALDRHSARRLDSAFGAFPSAVLSSAPDAHEVTLQLALDALDAGTAGEATWWLYRHRDLARGDVLRRIADDADRTVSWLAASIAAMWADPAAEPRLVAAVDSLEHGVEWDADQDELPMRRGRMRRLVPRWLAALALLRVCGTAACLPAIERFLANPSHGFDTLATIAITIRRLAERGRLDTDDARGAAARILDRVQGIEPVGERDVPSRDVARVSVEAITSGGARPRSVEYFTLPPYTWVSSQLKNTEQDFGWQLGLEIHRARAALGLVAPDDAVSVPHVAHALVRRAFDRAGVPVAEGNPDLGVRQDVDARGGRG